MPPESIAALITAIGTLAGVGGLLFSRRKTKAEADSVVVTSAETAVQMWQTMSQHLQQQLDLLSKECKEERARCRRLEVRYSRLAAAFRAAGHTLEEDDL